jgi:hypothetical protein
MYWMYITVNRARRGCNNPFLPSFGFPLLSSPCRSRDLDSLRNAVKIELMYQINISVVFKGRVAVGGPLSCLSSSPSSNLSDGPLQRDLTIRRALKHISACQCILTWEYERDSTGRNAAQQQQQEHVDMSLAALRHPSNAVAAASHTFSCSLSILMGAACAR